MASSSGVIINFLWRFAERVGAQLVSFIVSIVLARVLEPDVYGTIALILVITTILQVFVDSGLGNALIQKKNADNLDFSTVFFTNIAVCIIIYIGLFFASPWIAKFYKDETMTALIRVLSVTLLISGVKNVQQAYVSRNLLFRKFFFSTLGGTIAAAVVGISMARMGFGAWALVVQQIVNLSVDTIILWITVRWRPEWKFSWERLKSLFGYGWKLLVSSLIDSVYNNLRQLIIGKMYSASDLAFYNKGDQLPSLLVRNINSSIDSVLLPVMANEQDDKVRVREMTRRSIKISIYIMAPFMLGLCAVAEPLISLLLTDKWLPAVPFVRISCIIYMFYPVHTANLNAIKAMGRSDLFLKLEIWKKVIGLVVLVITVKMGVMAMAYSLLFTTVTSQLINSYPNKGLLGYNYLNQLKDFMPNIIIASVMAFCVFWGNYIPIATIYRLIIQVIVGVVLFVGLSWITKNDSFFYIVSVLKSFISRKK